MSQRGTLWRPIAVRTLVEFSQVLDNKFPGTRSAPDKSNLFSPVVRYVDSEEGESLFLA